MTKLTINHQEYEVTVAVDTPLLWVLRDTLGLTGTKFGCGMAQCGACTVHVDGEATRSCSITLADVVGKKIITIEGLAGDKRHPLQAAWIAEDVPQCGYCQPGMIMTAAALLAKKPQLNTEEIDQALANNICRCGTYLRIRQAIQRVANA
jgi:aerobic-type carbon monoxide dehydrogenase small subunit (CoxS/CutS family)